MVERRATPVIRPRRISPRRWARKSMPGWLGELDPALPLSLYLHVPFCDRLCYYCGCNTSVVRLDTSRRAYAALIEREIALVAAFIGRRARVSHIHWGGGTPTSLPGDRLISVMKRVRKLFAVEADAEIAIELDPTSLPVDRLEALSAMGITRISLGVQDLDPAVQEAIGRQQSYEQTEACAASGARSRRPFAQPRPHLRPAAADRRKRRAHRPARARTQRRSRRGVRLRPRPVDEETPGADPRKDVCPAPSSAISNSRPSTASSPRRAAISRSASTITRVRATRWRTRLRRGG